MTSYHIKIEPTRKIITFGGNIIDHPGEVTTITEDIKTYKTLINSTISTPDAKFMYADISNFNLNTPIGLYKYMQLNFDIIPQDIIDEYNLIEIVHNVKVYIYIRKGVYGIPQNGSISHDILKKHL